MATKQNEPIKGHEAQTGGFKDRRARLSAKPGARDLVYGKLSEPTNILKPMWDTGGLLWPYTPIINDNASVNYDSYDPVHSNQPYMAFKSVAPKEIMCSGQFTAMNQDEGRYCVAAIHFLRTITKMYFGVGKGDSLDSLAAIALRGTPPPVLLFNAHGTTMFHNVPVIVTSYSIEFPQDVDYVEVDLSNENRENLFTADFDISQDNTLNQENGAIRTFSRKPNSDLSAWVPTRFTITANMTVQNPPNRWRRNFNLNDFRTGNLVKKGGWV